MSSFSNKFSGYTMTQLNEILEDDEKLTKMVQEMDEMQEVQQNKEKTLANNRTLAEQNLALQPSLEHRKEDLTKRYRCLQERFESFQLRKSTLGKPPHQETPSLDTLLALLQTEGAKIEEETENMADSFMDGEINLDSFIDSYQSKRKLAHLRRVKIEKLQEMDVSAGPAPLTEADSSTPSPLAQPRRKPPPPPSQPAPILSPAPSVAPQSSAFYSPYPPIPPRTGQPFPNIPTGYPNHYISQYPPPAFAPEACARHGAATRLHYAVKKQMSHLEDTVFV
ncbi:Vacuolar protein sorting-associated protein 37B [Oryzias melastigma]|uniref:Vacuolar protein sorting-associated protein 37B n=1 Tax=Oryzias melastigma TaxID=30732 RepID=A0A834CD25_ORYME|nr:Vacuolar protein sorting-associated protein 37B [Oryzias melastigma]